MTDGRGFGPPTHRQKSYVCVHVFEDRSPVLYVTRPEGDWCFLCDLVHADESASFRVVALHHLIERDESLLEVLDLGVNEEAERSQVGGAWTRSSF